MQKGSSQTCFSRAFCFFAASLCSIIPAFAVEQLPEINSPANNSRTDSIQNPNEQSMRVLWTVSSYHRTPTATWGDAEARKFLALPLDITTSSIFFNGQRCTDVTFSSSVAETASYFQRRFQLSPSLVHYYGKEVHVVRTSCNIPEFKEYVRLIDRRVLLFSHGVLFVLSPAVHY